MRLPMAAVLVGVLVGAGVMLAADPRPDISQNKCPTGFAEMSRVELIFGLSRKGKPDVSQSEWQTFLDREVTTRFPDGLTVMRGDGQWRNGAGVIVAEPARVLLVWARPTADLGSRIEAVRNAWKALQQQESVLRADDRSCVSF